MDARKQRMLRKGTLTIREVFEAIETQCGDISDGHKYYPRSFTINGEKFKLSPGMRNFYLNGLTCVFCKLEGEFFAIEKHPPPRDRRGKGKKQNPQKRWHLNLYGYDHLGREVLMTHDHWVPKSKGGRRGSKRNMRTMCSICNNFKGNMSPAIYNFEQTIASLEGL